MKFIKIGFVTGSFGLDGILKIRPLTETPEVFFLDDMKYLLLAENGQKDPSRSLKILTVEVHGEFILVECDRVDTKAKADALKNMSVLITEDKLPKPADDEVYWYMIEGACVEDEEGNFIGTLADYMEGGGTDIFCIQLAHGGEGYVSNNKTHVLKIDAEAKKVVIDPRGLVIEG